MINQLNADIFDWVLVGGNAMVSLADILVIYLNDHSLE